LSPPLDLTKPQEIRVTPVCSNGVVGSTLSAMLFFIYSN
jgi:hypothetical protein